MSESVVVDASLVFRWLIEEEYSDRAHEAQQHWFNNRVNRVAPHFMPVEVTNVLLQRVKRSDLRIEEGTRMVETLLSSDIELYHTHKLNNRALELAHQLGQGAVYDCHYLALAELLDREMWTADERYYRCASLGASRLRLLSEFVAPES